MTAALMTRLGVFATVIAMAATGCAVGADPMAGRNPVGPTVQVDVASRPTSSVVATAGPNRVVARDSPSVDGLIVSEHANPTTNGAPLVFQVLAIEGAWAQVLLPIRPNGSRGWIPLADVTLASNPYRLEIETDRHRLTVWHEGRLFLEAPVAIGTGSTPTPLGEFYLTELLRPPEPDGPYGTYAYGLSGFSETLQEFNGGNGVIGLHGTNDPGSLGTDVSHGCVRLANDTIDELASILPLGTPVVIT